MKSVAALTLALAAALIAGCGSGTDNATATSTSAPVTSAAPAPGTTGQITTSAVPPVTTTVETAGADLRGKTCRDMRQMWDALGISGQDATTKALGEALDWFPTTPEWATLTEAQRQATVQGARDAAAGACK